MRLPLKTLSLPLSLFVLLLLAAGCGGSHNAAQPARPTTSAPAASSANVIVIKNFAYQPATLTVAPGSEVTVKNDDTATHTVTADAPHTGAFDTGDVAPGSQATFKAPTTPGTYPYICSIHQFMHGTLIVS